MEQTKPFNISKQSVLEAFKKVKANKGGAGVDRQTIEEVYEPYLLSKGLLIRSPRGRMISDLAKQHLNY